MFFFNLKPQQIALHQNAQNNAIFSRAAPTVPSAAQRNNVLRTHKDELEKPFDCILVRIERKKIIAMLG